MREFALKVNEDKLIGHAWEVKDPIANVVIFQGMEEYGLRYGHFAKFLNQNCINAYALDCYGQGSNVKSDFSNESFWPEDGFFKMVDAHYCMVEEAKKMVQKLMFLRTQWAALWVKCLFKDTQEQ